MRQSLSKSVGAARATLAAVALSVVIAVAALVDQVGPQSLSEHATAMYAPHGKDPGGGLLYGLLYGIAVVGGLLWLLALRSVRANRRSARVWAVVVTIVSASLAALVFTSAEYGTTLYPPVWGVLALLPALAGLTATVLLFRKA